MKPITLAGFAEKFAQDSDPWQTWKNRDEACKRAAILHALAPGVSGRMLELGAGNGSNSAALARRALRLDATEATEQGTELVRTAIADRAPRARAFRLVAPDPPPRARYDAIVIAELLYYLSPRDMTVLAQQVAARLRPGGVLVLAHHRITFYDFAQHAEGIHARFLHASGADWTCRIVRRTARWGVLSCRLR
ncbi:SAM-dependent methyltransferase [Sphingomonas sp. MMS12-HWE2-04]|uniref:SAM-dependent methyltransferase n=1 Tax=Sphingomonas sp. MMS12-HWE2-04 TaxID=3234199 RepID=UPI00384AE3CC